LVFKVLILFIKINVLLCKAYFSDLNVGLSVSGTAVEVKRADGDHNAGVSALQQRSGGLDDELVVRVEVVIRLCKDAGGQ